MFVNTFLFQYLVQGFIKTGNGCPEYHASNCSFGKAPIINITKVLNCRLHYSFSTTQLQTASAGKVATATITAIAI